MNYQGINATSGRAISGLDHLRQSIRDILLTPLGSRLARREYGSLLPFLIDQPQNGLTRLKLMSATAAALRRWEPRLRLTRVIISDITQHGGCTLFLEGARLDGPSRGKSADLSLTLISGLSNDRP